MSDWLLALVPQYGLWLMAVVTFLSCLALPLPCSLLMMTAGGFAASGDLVLWQVSLAGLVGAVAGDQVGYGIGRAGGDGLMARMASDPRRARLVARSIEEVNRRGAIGVFLTRWLFSAVGPWANFAAGASRFDWPRFSLWAAAGEAVWVGLYVGIGYAFAGNIEAASQLAGSVLGVLAGLATMLIFGAWLLAALHHERQR